MDLITIMFLFFIFTQNIHCEELSLNSAIEIALKNNSDWKINQKNKENVILQKDKNKTLLYPSVNLGSSYSHLKPQGADGSNTFLNSVSVNQSIFNRKNYLQIDQSNLSIEQTKYLETEIKHKIILEVKTAFFNILLLESKLNFYKDSFNRDEEQLKYAKNLLEIGKVIETEVLRAEITLEKTRQNLNTTQNALKSAKMILNNILNVEIENDFKFISNESIDDGIKKIFVESLVLEEYTNKAIKNNYQLKIKNYEQEISKTNIQIAKTGYLPIVSGSGSYNWSDDKINFKDRDWRAGISLSWQIFDAGLTKTNVRQAETDKDRISEERIKLEREIILNIKKIYNELENLKISLEVSKKNLALSEKNYNIVKVQYQNGLVSNLNLIDAEVVYNEAKINIFDAYYNYKIKQAEWEDAIGDEF